MTKFQEVQLTRFLDQQGFKKGCSSLREYERAKSLLFPFGRIEDPIKDLPHGETCFFLAEFLKV